MLILHCANRNISLREKRQEKSGSGRKKEGLSPKKLLYFFTAAAAPLLPLKIKRYSLPKLFLVLQNTVPVPYKIPQLLIPYE
jgi:hypothetical protein